MSKPFIRILRLATTAIALSSLPVASANQDPDRARFESHIGNENSTYHLAPQSGEMRDAGAPFRRRIMREDISIRVKKLRLDSGKKVSLIYGMPKNAKNCPAVFVLDVETNALANSMGKRMPGLSDRKRKEMRQSAYLFRSPFGSNLLGNGFAVAYIVAEDLDAIRSARTGDWIGIFDRVRDLRKVDDNSVFLFSTREYANLSVYLASKYSFSGFILEEPGYLLFSRDTHDHIIENSANLTPEEIWQRTDPTREHRYLEVLSRITSPIMLIRNPESRAYVFNQKTLIPKLIEAHTFFESVEIDGPRRALTTFGGKPSGVIEISPEVSYYPSTVSLWVDEMISYMKINSSAEAVALRNPASYRTW